ncbi:NADH-quinone oxidoreductase subunit M [Natronosporangium hydrolyticum]|uniref:NADH-quinone oxidoreductase subunit M n=1 Tax=Natronosporangium hydrolyticum TaxID=2811111 RepID=A0A895YKX1_9ACTN|nr:NADH-quinone oxidoreductase subunit M [Natronosporangium hydrolyticum]QSB15306.1 NADH-quinone oxidoreductase subunit M [Natronosporangium hydrolyticum]
MTAGQVLLVAVLVLPALGATVVAALPRRVEHGARTVGVGFAAAAFLTSLLLLPGPDRYGWFAAGPAPAVQPWHAVQLDWVPGLDLQFHIGVDGISYPLVVLTTLLTLLCALYTRWRAPAGGRGRTLVALLLVIEVGILGTFLALDLVLFFIFFEVVLLPMWAVIAFWGGDDRRRAARKFALYTLLGSVLLLVGVFTVVTAAGTADIVALSNGDLLTRGTQLVAFSFLALAFAVKSPLWPLHTWLPDAHTEAPTVGSVILAGVLLKMGTYGLIRIGVGVTPEGVAWAAPVLGVLAVAAILIGALVCLAQTELKRLIAYSSVGHMGFVLLGVATLSAAGIQAALIGNIAHGLITGLLFFLVGAVKDRTHTGDLTALSGLRERAPALAGLLGFAAIASLGLPGLAGFWGELFAVVAAVQEGGALWLVLGIVAALGAAVTAAYFLRLLRRVTHGEPSPAVAAAAPAQLTRIELVTWSPLVLLIVAIGVMPALVLAMAYDPVAALVAGVGR